jgi:hypothetical protein
VFLFIYSGCFVLFLQEHGAGVLRGKAEWTGCNAIVQ